MSARPGARRGRTVEEWFGTVGTIAGGIAAVAGFVYLVGGMVMWLRFRTADLPADQAVALMSREQLFVVGLRLMILPTLVTGALAAALAYREAHKQDGSRGVLGWSALAVMVVLGVLAPVWWFAAVGWPAELAVLLEAVVVAGALVVEHRRRGPRPDTVTSWTPSPATGDGPPGGSAAIPRWLTRLIIVAAVALAVLLCVAVPDLAIGNDRLGRAVLAAAAVLMIFSPVLLPLVRTLSLPWGRMCAALALVLAAALIAATPDWWTRVAVALGTLLLLGVIAMIRVTSDGRGRGSIAPTRFVVIGLVVVVAGLIVPFSFASATWPLGLAIIVWVWLWRRDRLLSAAPGERDAESRRLAVFMGAAAILAAAVVSIGRQLDEPVQLLHATVVYKDPARTVVGLYVNASGDTVYLGDEKAGTIQAIPRSEIHQVDVGPPEDRAPSPSLLSRLIPGDERFSVRPLEVWCDGERYGWLDADAVCETQPSLVWTTRDHDRFLDRLGMPTRVMCPEEASDVCRGWLILTSRRSYLQGRPGVARPVETDPVPFAVSPNLKTEVCTTLSVGELKLLRRESGEKPVPFEAVLARDPEGETVLHREPYGLLVGRRRIHDVDVHYSDCVPRLTTEAWVARRAVRVTVTARPRGRGITPFHVQGRIRLAAARVTEPVQPPDRRAHGDISTPQPQELVQGTTEFNLSLAPGRWLVTARYTSVAGLRFRDPASDTNIVVPRR